MAIIKIEELHAVTELTSEELSLTKGGTLLYVSDDVVDTGDIVFTVIGATFSKSWNGSLNGNDLF